VRQGALPFGDWVFSVVDYPFHKRKFNIKPSSRTGLVSQFFRSEIRNYLPPHLPIFDITLSQRKGLLEIICDRAASPQENRLPITKNA
ncbi:MAG: hypothetical protein WBB43_02310, partial [Limnoraphis sp.]